MNHLQVAHGKDSEENFSSLSVCVWWVPRSQPQTEPACRQSQELGTPPWELAGCKPSSAPAHKLLSATLDCVEAQGLSFFLASNLPDIWIPVFCFLGVQLGHQAVRYLGDMFSVLSISLSLFFFLGKTVVYMIYLFQGKLESQTKTNARREKLFPLQVYSYNNYKIVEQPRIIII